MYLETIEIRHIWKTLCRSNSSCSNNWFQRPKFLQLTSYMWLTFLKKVDSSRILKESLIYMLEKSRWQNNFQLEHLYNMCHILVPYVWHTPKQTSTIFLNSSFYFVLRQKKRSTVRTLYFHRFITSIYYLINFFSDFVFQCCWMASTWTRTSRIRSDDYLETSRLWKIHHGKLQEVYVQSSSQYSSTIKQQLYCNRIIKS